MSCSTLSLDAVILALAFSTIYKRKSSLKHWIMIKTQQNADVIKENIQLEIKQQKADILRKIRLIKLALTAWFNRIPTGI